MNLDAVESEEENYFSQDDINRNLNSSVDYGQYYDYAVNESSLGYASEYSDNEVPDFLNYFQNLQAQNGEPHMPIMVNAEEP